MVVADVEAVEGSSKSRAQGWVRALWIGSFPELLTWTTCRILALGPSSPVRDPSMRADLFYKTQLCEVFPWKSLLFFWLNQQLSLSFVPLPLSQPLPPGGEFMLTHCLEHLLVSSLNSETFSLLCLCSTWRQAVAGTVNACWIGLDKDGFELHWELDPPLQWFHKRNARVMTFAYPS